MSGGNVDVGSLTMQINADVSNLKKQFEAAQKDTAASLDKIANASKRTAEALDRQWRAMGGGISALGEKIGGIGEGFKKAFGEHAPKAMQKMGDKLQKSVGLTDKQVQGLEQMTKAMSGAISAAGRLFSILSPGMSAFLLAAMGVMMAWVAIEKSVPRVADKIKSASKSIADLFKGGGQTDNSKEFNEDVERKRDQERRSFQKAMAFRDDVIAGKMSENAARVAIEKELAFQNELQADFESKWGKSQIESGKWGEKNPNYSGKYFGRVKEADWLEEMKTDFFDTMEKSVGKLTGMADGLMKRLGFKSEDWLDPSEKKKTGHVTQVSDQWGLDLTGARDEMYLLMDMGIKTIDRDIAALDLIPEATDEFADSIAESAAVANAAIERFNRDQLNAMQARDARASAAGRGEFFDTSYQTKQEYESMGRAGKGAANQMFGAALNGNPRLSATAQGAAQGSAAGPWGALVGAIAGLLSTSKALPRILKVFERFLGQIIIALEPILLVIAQVLDSLKPVLDLFAKAIHGIAYAIMQVAIWIAKIIDAIPGVSTKDFISQLEEAQKKMSVKNLENVDATDDLANSANNATTALDSFTSSLTNVPTGFKVEAARFNAMTAQGSTTISNTSIAVSASTPSSAAASRAMADDIAAAQKEVNMARTGRPQQQRNVNQFSGKGNW